MTLAKWIPPCVGTWTNLVLGTVLFWLLAATGVVGQVESGNATEKSITTSRTKVDRENDRNTPAAKKDREEYYELLMIFADTIDQIDRNYVEKVSRRELVEAAIDGILKKLDPYSNYIPPDELDEFKLEVENEFGGIGIQVSKVDGMLRVISPVVGTPAYAAGIVAGDLVLEVDGTPTKELSIDDATNLMKGRAGTEVRLKVFHPLHGTTEDIVLIRQAIKIETVLGDRRKADDRWQFMYDTNARIGYVRVTSFGRETTRDLKSVVEGLTSQSMRGLVLDLRFNPGGLLKSAIEVSDLFLSSGTIVGTAGRNIKPRSWAATEPNTFSDFPMVVMVNQYSASASEIVAAALQDHQRAIVVGEQTFGKASVQNVVELEGGKSALKITTGSYQRPSGKPIHHFPGAAEWGVQPNETYRVSLSDFELSQIMRRRRERDLLTGQRESEPSSTFDPQIRRAMSYLRAEIMNRQVNSSNAEPNKKADERSATPKLVEQTSGAAQ